ncbi:hypothetical protein FIBSPDRAFT_244415 [Athelia psychrophila]|uniref:Uncharacterized protein n=1 Tax=Athelia psychrophila TaxID=1759441 RepID=A0A166RS13_9AGAM|nr:hypothetical protein FIBSPDRAFT_244415 [Fibularhizoctonia sp. CBS 109695]
MRAAMSVEPSQLDYLFPPPHSTDSFLLRYGGAIDVLFPATLKRSRSLEAEAANLSVSINATRNSWATIRFGSSADPQSCLCTADALGKKHEFKRRLCVATSIILVYRGNKLFIPNMTLPFCGNYLRRYGKTRLFLLQNPISRNTLAAFWSSPATYVCSTGDLRAGAR